MSTIFPVLVLIALGGYSLDSCSAQDKHAPPVKHRLDGKKNTKNVPKEPARNEDWYLNQLRQSDRFRAIALEGDNTKISTDYRITPSLIQQATITNLSATETGAGQEGGLKKGTSLPGSKKITFMFVPPLSNLKFIDLQKRADTHPTFMMSWHE